MFKNADTVTFGLQDFFRRRAKSAVLWVAGMMTMATLFIAWSTFRHVVATATSSHTETTSGTITKVKVNELPKSTRRLAPTHSVELEYVYTVEGQELTGTRYRAKDMGPVSGLIIAEVLSNYHRGDRVDVHYNSADSSDAVLKPIQFKKDSIKHLVACLLFTLLLWVVGYCLP